MSCDPAVWNIRTVIWFWFLFSVSVFLSLFCLCFSFSFLSLFFLLVLRLCLIYLVPFLLMAAMLWIFLLRILQYFVLRNRFFLYLWLLSVSLEMIVWSAVYMCCHCQSVIWCWYLTVMHFMLSGYNLCNTLFFFFFTVVYCFCPFPLNFCNCFYNYNNMVLIIMINCIRQKGW